MRLALSVVFAAVAFAVGFGGGVLHEPVPDRFALADAALFLALGVALPAVGIAAVGMAVRKAARKDLAPDESPHIPEPAQPESAAGPPPDAFGAGCAYLLAAAAFAASLIIVWLLLIPARETVTTAGLLVGVVSFVLALGSLGIGRRWLRTTRTLPAPALHPASSGDRPHLCYAALFTAATVVGNVAASLVADVTVDTHLGDLDGEGPSLRVLLGMVTQMASISGMIVGLAQALALRAYVQRLLTTEAPPPSPTLLRRELRNTLWWPVATVGGALASAIGSAMFAQCALFRGGLGLTWLGNVLLLNAVYGALLGFAQWLLLRRRAWRAHRWILFSVGGVLAGSLCCNVLWRTMMSPAGTFPPGTRCVLAAIFGLIFGGAQAYCLVHLPPRLPRE